jgi:murein DD-endopeptidase MepM/ murein hydrolase activator NlpD
MRALSFLAVLIFFSCNTSRTGIFGKKSPHEAYASRLTEAKLENTPFVRSWMASAAKAVNQPVEVSIPYKETGYFAPERPFAAGLSFPVRRGQKIIIRVQTTPEKGALWFLDLWETSNNKRELLSSTDSSNRTIEYEVSRDGQYILRFQPELMVGLGYSISISSTASLAFPVRQTDNPRIISLWGVDRDAGARRHEGIDIAAKKRTPVVACADGKITNVTENKLGGKVVFMRPSGKNYSLYYAHLDEQSVSSGDNVKAGDVVGLIGNTGNAASTTPHLHFGIYAIGGAVDPLPFIDPAKKEPKQVQSDTGILNSYARLTATSKVTDAVSIKAGSVVRLSSATESSYKIETPDGRTGIVKNSVISKKELNAYQLKTDVSLFDTPTDAAAVVKVLLSGSRVSVIGNYNDWQFVEASGFKGWIRAS